MRKLLLNSTIFECNLEEIQKHLKRAYDERHRAFCLCQGENQPLSLYITCYQGKYILKRYPNTGTLHHIECESYIPPAELSGLESVSEALKEDKATGQTTIKVDFRLNTSNRNPPEALGGTNNQVKKKQTKLTLLSLLEYCFEVSGLLKWYPKMEGKRSYFLFRSLFLEQAEALNIKKEGFLKLLYIPEVFQLERKEEINIRRKILLRGRGGNGEPRYILIGQVKELSEIPSGLKLLVKHCPDFPFIISADMVNKMKRVYEFPLSFLSDDTNHVMVVSTFYLNYKGLAICDEIAFLPVNDQWIPFYSLPELTLINHLIQTKRKFIKSLKYGVEQDQPISVALLMDTQEPIALFFEESREPDYQEKINQLITEQSRGYKPVLLSEEFQEASIPPIPIPEDKFY